MDALKNLNDNLPTRLYRIIYIDLMYKHLFSFSCHSIYVHLGIARF